MSRSSRTRTILATALVIPALVLVGTYSSSSLAPVAWIAALVLLLAVLSLATRSPR
ncbi:hypothetical protein OO014_02280 [Intrasporangium calvum]|uniref:Uncharacterized protein n=1 Tax=Intrasporangium calvum TaxID=53358 RepID=A0ABT5GD74_9MICO|nr:hypothetical protein [Intrasporangium calvum]MDC5696069.1 hypothetical protein [Intrasporangium calvum]